MCGDAHHEGGTMHNLVAAAATVWPLVLATVASCCWATATASSPPPPPEREWTPAVAPGCPALCSCIIYLPGLGDLPPLRTVNCSSGKLVAAPDDLPAGTEALVLRGNPGVDSVDGDGLLPDDDGLRYADFSDNALAAVPVNLTGSLVVLNLAGNRIRKISGDTLALLTRLKVLLLDRNRINVIDADAFVTLAQLEEISLADNNLQEMDGEWFRASTHLMSVRLDGNDLRAVPVANGLTGKLRSLSLAHNAIVGVDARAFANLTRLRTLALDHNALTVLPTAALRQLTNIKNVSLSSNLFDKLTFHAFSYIDVREIRVNRVPTLYSVDEEAFYKLQYLELLELTGNSKLTYLDPAAFAECSRLRELRLQDNNLLALDSNIANALPSLASLSLYHNPLHCDCNVYWIRALMAANHSLHNVPTVAVTMRSTPLTLQHAEKFVCDTPVAVNARPLAAVPLAALPPTCPPTVIPFFSDSQQAALGGSVTLECRAVGVPAPHVHWLLASGKLVNNTSNASRVRLDTAGSRLTVQHIKAGDAGTYTCVATSAAGSANTSSVLRVHNTHTRVLLQGVAADFVMLTWSGTGSTVSSTSYVLLYHRATGGGTDSNAAFSAASAATASSPSSAVDSYSKISVRPYMRAYTVSNLQPDTDYEFCLAYESPASPELLVKLDCKRVRTRAAYSASAARHSVRALTIVIGLSTAASFLLFLCVLSVFVRKYRQRKAYAEPAGLNMAAAAGASPAASGGHMTTSHIPLDNLYKPPSTPLCTSTTSLIGASNA